MDTENNIDMKKNLILALLSLCFFACNPSKSTEKKEELKKYDENGKLIVYSQEVYAKMWTKNRNLDVTVIDTFCMNQTERAIRDIKNGKLIYFGFHPREFEKLTKMLRQHGIEIKKFTGTDVRLGDFEPYCYENEMTEEISRKFGENFIDSLFKIAQKEYIIENPNEEYIYDGVDLRAKYLGKSNSH